MREGVERINGRKELLDDESGVLRGILLNILKGLQECRGGLGKHVDVISLVYGVLFLAEFCLEFFLYGLPGTALTTGGLRFGAIECSLDLGVEIFDGFGFDLLQGFQGGADGGIRVRITAAFHVIFKELLGLGTQ